MLNRPLAADMLLKLAPRLGARVVLEPFWGMAGQITFPSGRRRYFRLASIDLNALGAAEIAKDKDFAAFFMRGMGYPTPEGRAFYSRRWAQAIGSDQTIEAACSYARGLGWPVIVKPNSGSQGREVRVVYNQRELVAGLSAVFHIDRVALIQQIIRGRDFRIVVLDDEVVAAYERIPLHVTGDGRSTVEGLLTAKREAFTQHGRDQVIDFDDLRIRKRLRRCSYHLESVIPYGEIVYLLDNANLSAGGEAVDFTDNLHPEFRRLAIRLTRDMGLRLSGIDLIVKGDVAQPPSSFSVIEINASPGLEHFAKVGDRQAGIVEAIYRGVLKSLDTGP